MSDVQTWNVAAASNNSAAPNGFPEGMPPSGVNDAAREVMAAVARYRSDTDGVNTSSGTNTITLAASRTMTAYAQGDLFTFKAGGTNTGATTLNVDSLGAKDVQLNGSALAGGEIVSGLMYSVVYDGTQFQLLNSSSLGAAVASSLRITQTASADALLVEDSANPDSTPFVINSDGKVLVGNTTSIDNSTIQTFAALSHFSYTANANAFDYQFKKSRSATSGSNAIVSSGDTLGNIYFYGDDGADFINAARIAAQVDGTPGTNDMPGRLVFYTTADGSSSTTERMRINSSGNVSIGDSGNATQSLRIAKNTTGGTSAAGVAISSTIQSDVTTTVDGFLSFFNTAASSFTLTNLRYFTAARGTIGATSAISNQTGFLAGSSLTGATNNYGFYGDIADGSGRWNFYANGTAPNYFSGNVLIGSNSAAQTSIGQTPNFQLVGDAFLTASSMQASFNTAAAGPTNYYFKARGTQASPTIVSSGDSLGLFAFEGYDGNQACRGASIEAEVDGTPGASDMPGRIVFRTTADGAASATERMRITNAGNVGIGTSSPATRFHVDGTIRYTNRPAAGTITAIGFDTNGDLKASSSSQRYKYDIFGYDKGINEVMQLRPVSFKYNGETRQNIGFIAEEIDAAGLTEVMLYNEQSQPEGVLYANMIALLTKAIQEQQATIAALEARLAAVEAR